MIGELHPWSTWPTVHRGVTNETHRINFINQDLSCRRMASDMGKLADKNVSIEFLDHFNLSTIHSQKYKVLFTRYFFSNF